MTIRKAVTTIEEQAQDKYKRYTTDTQANSIQEAFTPKQVAQAISLSTSSVRSYSSALESAGYSILRNAQEWRVYTESDIVTLRQLKQMIDSGFSMDKASEIIVSKLSIHKETAATTEVSINVDVTDRLDQITLKIDEQNKKTDILAKEYINSSENMAKEYKETFDAMAKEMADIKAINSELLKILSEQMAEKVEDKAMVGKKLNLLNY